MDLKLKKFISLSFFILLVVLGFSQGAGIRYLDTIPTDAPNIARRHSVVVFNTTNSKYYQWDGSLWKDMGHIRVVDSTTQILNEKYSLGERILNKVTNEQFVVQADSFFLVDSIYAIPVDTAYAVWQPGFNHQGEFVLDSVDNGDYRLQSSGYVRLFDNTGTITFEDGTWLFDANIGFGWLIIEGDDGAELDVMGTTSDATLSVGTNTSAWFISSQASGGDFQISGGTGDFKIRTSVGVYPFFIEDNAINGAFTIKASGILNSITLPTYADDTAAGVGGLVTGDIYQTASGELRIKL